MKAFLIFWILGASLAACSTTPREYPTCEIPGPAPDVGHALTAPDMPVETSSDQQGATYDREGLLQLARVWQAGLANATIAEENAQALEARNAEVSALIECTRFQNVWIELQGEDLRDEQRAHVVDNLWHRGIIFLGVLAVAL